jgi:putative Mn2+ efflux pump MntP
MYSSEVVLLGSALAIDAGVVSFAIGLLSLKHLKKEQWQRGLLIAAIFGLFQFAMLWAGSYIGYVFSFSEYGYLFQIVVAMIFFVLAIKFFQESLAKEKKTLRWGIWPITTLGFVTSLDALAAGVSFGTLPQTYLAAMDVGIITFIICGLFYIIAHYFHHIPERWLLRMAGIVFTLLGANIFKHYI